MVRACERLPQAKGGRATHPGQSGIATAEASASFSASASNERVLLGGYASLLTRASSGLRFNEHLDEEDGPLVFQHACKLGLEGIVSKRKDSRYRSGRSPHWIKTKNPDAPAVKREAEEDWGGWSAKSRHSRR